MAVVVTVNIEIDTSLKHLLTRVLVLFGFGSELNKTASVGINVTLRRVRGTFLVSGVPGWGVLFLPQNYEGPPKSCQTQPDCKKKKLLNLGRQHPKMFGKKAVKF